MKSLILLALMAILVGGPRAKAQSLFYDSCVQATASVESEDLFYLAAYKGGPLGLTCEDIKTYKAAGEAIQMALYPATLVLTMTPAREAIAGELATLGLTMANPAVLGITVIGAIGVTTFYFVMKATVEDCERMDRELLKQAIEREMELKYGLKTKSIPLEIKKP